MGDNGTRFANSPIPRVGPPRGRRGKGHSSAWSSWSWTEAQKLFGVHNPHQIGDATIGLMESDPTLGLCVEIWTTAYHTVQYWVDGPDAELNAFVESQWERYHREWIHTLLGALTWGRISAELVWGLEDVQYRYTTRSGRERNRVRSNAYVIKKLRDYHPATTSVLVDSMGDFAGVQLLDGVKLAKGEVIHVVNDGRFGDLRGKSLLRRSYSPWWWSNLIYLAANRYVERKGDPPLIGFAPSEEELDENGAMHDPIKTLAVLAANLRSSGNSILPGEFDPESRQRLYELREMKVAERAGEFLPLAQHYEAMKAIGTLTMPDQAGSPSAFASAKVSKRAQHNLFSSRQRSLILNPINRWLIPKLIKANFPSVMESSIPQIRGGNLSDNALEILAELVQSAQKTAAITGDGKAVPMGSLVDWGKALKALSVPTIDPSRIPDDLPVDVDRTNAGMPKAIQTNPNRPEGPSEKGMSFAAESPEEKEAAAWLDEQVAILGEIDAVVNDAAEAVEAARVAAEEEIRAVMVAALDDISTVETSDGREVVSTRNRTLPKQVGDKVREILGRMNDSLLVESEIDGAAFAKRAPLSDAHIRAAQAASRNLSKSKLPVARGGSGARVARDVARDGKTNAMGVQNREGRRLQELFDRLVQGGGSRDLADQLVSDYFLPDRDLVSSTVAHVRGTARATHAWSGVLKSDDVGGWVVAASDSAQTKVMTDFPKGKVSELMWRTFDTAEDLDDWYEGFVTSKAKPALTSWRNLGRTYGSEEYYLPIPKSLAAGVVALAARRLSEWRKRREERQEEMRREREESAVAEDMQLAIEQLEASLEN